MKVNKFICSVVAAVAVGTALAAVVPGIENVTVRQNWPWDDAIGIDFTVTGTNCDVEVWASYDGVQPFRLAETDLTGDFTDAAPGARHIDWHLRRAGLGLKESLMNFKVSLVPVDVAEHTYLILNLRDGTYEYAATAPDKGWRQDNSAYVLTKMVFRRIPAGTFNMGTTDEICEWSYRHEMDNYLYNARSKLHSTTISRDYYMAVYPVTSGQLQTFTNAAAGGTSPATTGHSFFAASYDAVRGSRAEGINWPITAGDRYAVSDGSFLGQMRKVAKLPANWVIDLPTSAQWERAAKAEMPDDYIYPTGGTPANTDAELWDIVGVIATTGKNRPSSGGSYVGQRQPNAYGVYDMCGLCFEWNLDYYENAAPEGLVDPVGPTSNNSNLRVRRNYTGGTTEDYRLDAYTPMYYGYYASDNSMPSFRFCISLHRIGRD